VASRRVSSRVFTRESFLDEVAHALGKDPLHLRIDLLQPGDVLSLGDQKIDRGRMIHVIETLRTRFDWSKWFAVPGRLAGKGLAINIYDSESYMAQVAEVSVSREFGDLKIHRIVCVFDCGLAINPAGLEGQVESGITWGLSATLHGKIDLQERKCPTEWLARFSSHADERNAVHRGVHYPQYGASLRLRRAPPPTGGARHRECTFRGDG
jgi:CO/xanthine dehydrogenase Mo-binding subunit